MPRQWEGGAAVSPHSVVNLRSGTMTTVIPIGEVSVRTFSLSFNLYHNSYAATKGFGTWPGLISPGPGWSTSYSGSVYTYTSGTSQFAVVVEDDGTRNTFTQNGTLWVPPVGIHDRLRKDVPQTGWWTLTYPDQSKRVFDDTGVLREEINTAGLKIFVERFPSVSPPRIDIRPEGFPFASGGNVAISIDYVSFTNKPVKPLRVRVHNGPGTSMRSYWFGYGPQVWTDCSSDAHCYPFPLDSQTECGTLQTPISDSSFFNWLAYPPREAASLFPPCVLDRDLLSFRHNANGTIQEIKERDANRWTYAYHDGTALFQSVTQHPLTGGASAITQSWSYCVPSLTTQCFKPKGGEGLNAASWSYFTDPRGYVWTRTFDASRRVIALFEPVTGARTLFGYDSANNVTTRTDPLNRVWTTTYGPVGNPLTWATPISGQTTEAQYEVPSGEPSDTNFYRLKETIDPAGWQTEFFYESTIDTTKVTKIREQDAATQGGTNVADTILEYTPALVSGGEYNPKGLIAAVTDANGVRTEWTYDKDGDSNFRTTMREGVIPGSLRGGIDGIPVDQGNAFDQAGNNTDSSLDNVICSGGGGDNNNDGRGERRGCLRPEQFLLGSTLPFAPPRLVPTTGTFAVPSPTIPTIDGCESNAGLSGDDLRDGVGRPLKWRSCTGDSTLRETNWTYNDPFKRLSARSIVSDEPGFSLTRTFDLYTYDAAGAVTSMRGPDGRTTNYEYDFAGRVTRITRPGTPADVLAEYFYDDAGRLESAVAGNGVITFYTYDDADRLTDIQHVKSSGGATPQIARVHYVWSINNLVSSRSEYTSSDPAAAASAVVAFTYDRRGRLIQEARTGTDPYNLSYTYDQVGNRLTKTDNLSSPAKRVRYLYDLDEANCPPGNVTKNNRLMKYVEESLSGPPEAWVETRSVTYTYYRTGHASNIAVKDAGDPVYRDLALYNDVQGRVVIALWDSWEKDASGTPVNYQRIKAKQFRYDNADARQRYLTRELDAAALPTITPLATPKGQWVEYDGSSPYADGEYTHAQSGSYSVTKQYDPMSEKTVSSGAETHRHGDLIGSTIATTDANESSIARQTYSAFGEPVGTATVNTRYRYAGAFGYEDGLLSLDGAPNTPPIALLHLGERWYDPGIGRFVQRDPIGLEGGQNVYAYVDADPIALLDTDGRFPTPTNITKEYLFGKSGGVLNKGPIRIGYGWKGPRVGGQEVFRFAMGGKGWPIHLHLDGVLGASLGGLTACLVAWDIGWAAGDALNWATRKATGKSLSERFGDWISPPITEIPGWYNPGKNFGQRGPLGY